MPKPLVTDEEATVITENEHFAVRDAGEYEGIDGQFRPVFVLQEHMASQVYRSMGRFTRPELEALYAVIGAALGKEPQA